MIIRILRQNSPGSSPYWQEFGYEKKDSQTVAGMLDELNYKDDLTDITGKASPRIQWECSCLQGMCGGCAMVINGRPALACETFLRDLKGDRVVIEPLRKFPTISDLVVDRGIIQENLKKANAYIEERTPSENLTAEKKGKGSLSEHDHQYIVAKCLKCGLCLEVCPNYKSGENFYGAAFANDCYLIASGSSRQRQNIQRTYGEHFGKGCSKALSCMEVCPMKIPTLSSMAKMNKRSIK